MNKYFTIAAGLIASAALMAAAPAMAGHVNVDVNIGLPGLIPAPVYVEPRPVYIEREREHEWRERQQRAREWREKEWHERHHREDRRDHDD